jgi:hypothetical protein
MLLAMYSGFSMFEQCEGNSSAVITVENRWAFTLKTPVTGSMLWGLIVN